MVKITQTLQPCVRPHAAPPARPSPPDRTSSLQPAAVSRREALALPPLAALLPAVAAAASGWCALPAAAEPGAGFDPVAAAGAASAGSSFYARWPYVQPSDILPYLRATATPGDPESVLAAIDRFADFYPMYRCGPVKGQALEQLVKEQAPTAALELGTIRIARSLPPGGRVVSVEASEEQAEVARQVLALAGFDDPARVQVVTGLSSEVLPRLAAQAAGSGTSGPASEEQRFGLVFLDHCKPCYLPDLEAMEVLGLVGQGSLVVADNVLFPGTPEYLAHVQAPGSSSGATPEAAAAGPDLLPSRRSGSGSGSAGSAAGTQQRQPQAQAPRMQYDTRLVEAAFEVEQRYKRDWEEKRDALAVSRCLGPAPES